MLKQEKVESIKDSLNRLIPLFISALSMLFFMMINPCIFGFLFILNFMFIVLEFYNLNSKIRNYFGFEKYFDVEEQSNSVEKKEEILIKEKEELFKDDIEKDKPKNMDLNIEKDSLEPELKVQVHNEDTEVKEEEKDFDKTKNIDVVEEIQEDIVEDVVEEVPEVEETKEEIKEKVQAEVVEEKVEGKKLKETDVKSKKEEKSEDYKKYIRKLPKGRKASEKARKTALEYGYELKEGETFVVPKKKK